MLVRRERGLVTSRVLAGTIRRTGDDERDLALAAALARSSKDLEEHEYAVRSVADALEPHCSSMNVPEAPFVLHLPNVMHLASDVAGVVHDAGTCRRSQLAASLHPSAAGRRHADRRRRCELISEIEGMDRGRYAGPVGWMDAAGDGEWGIALRSAEIAGDTRPAVRRLRHRRRLRPRGRAGRGAGQVRPGARLAGRRLTVPGRVVAVNVAHVIDTPVPGAASGGTPSRRAAGIDKRPVSGPVARRAARAGRRLDPRHREPRRARAGRLRLRPGGPGVVDPRAR